MKKGRRAARAQPDSATKTQLAEKLNDLLAARGLSQSEVSRLLAMPQPKVSAIRNYKLDGISLQRLLIALTALGQDIEIVVRPSSASSRPGINVAA